MSKVDTATLIYFRRGHDRDPGQFWLADTNRQNPPLRVIKLANRGLLERASWCGDLFRITAAGLAALEA
jgi:hypothetical protein